MVDKNENFLREVEEEVRRERMQKLWSKYGNLVLAGAGALLVAVGGYQFMQNQARRSAEEGGAKLEAAAQLAKAGKTDEATKALEALASSDKPGYAAIAELTLAGNLVKAGKPQDALAAFEKIAQKPGIDPLIQGFAQLQAAGLRVGEADFTEVQNRLNPLMSEASPWKSLATELLGTAAIQAGKLTEARAALAPLLVDPKLSKTALERVQTLLGAIADKEASAAAATGASAPAANVPAAGDKK